MSLVSLVGKFFISYDSRGNMLRRGKVLRKCPKTYLCGLVDLWTGTFLGESRRYHQPKMGLWHFFDTIEECNSEYERHFGLNRRAKVA